MAAVIIQGLVAKTKFTNITDTIATANAGSIQDVFTANKNFLIDTLKIRLGDVNAVINGEDGVRLGEGIHYQKGDTFYIFYDTTNTDEVIAGYPFKED